MMFCLGFVVVERLFVVQVAFEEVRAVEKVYGNMKILIVCDLIVLVDTEYLYVQKMKVLVLVLLNLLSKYLQSCY